MAVLIGSISSLSTLVIFIFYLFQKIRVLKNEIKGIAIYSLYSFVNNLALDFANEITVLSLLFIFTILEYAVFTWLFYNMLQKRNSKRAVLFGSFIFLGIVCFSILHFGTGNFDQLNSGTEAVLIVIYSILFFVEQVSSMDIVEPIYEKPEFWIVLGCFIYLSGNLFLFITADPHNQNAWIINSIFNLVRNILFFIAIKKSSRNRKDNKKATERIEALNW
jgi:hypothetical protein